MGKTTGFIEFKRQLPERRAVAERVGDYHEIYERFPEQALTHQAARCMDCGIPFCQAGCPLGNIIPDWNDLVYHGRWREAYERLRLTNNFPEFTGRLCPAPCESACVLGLIDEPVTIEHIEQAIIERAFREGWVQPEPPTVRTGRQVAVIGSGPAGLACADQLNRAGHHVTVFERHDRPGGLLRYGIPDFKLEKRVLDRRLNILRAEGITFQTNADVGRSVPVSDLAPFDAVVLCGGATRPRDLHVEGRTLEGIHFAWDYLACQNRRIAGDDVDGAAQPPLVATGKHVIVIGGGDTGSDCVGTAHRQGAASVTQFELLPTPPETRPPDQPWPYMPMLLKTSSSQEEGGRREWRVMTQAFLGAAGRVVGLQTTRVRPSPSGRLEAVAGTEQTWDAELVLLAIGYAGPERTLPDLLGLDLGPRGTVQTDDQYRTNKAALFAAGDLRRGQSLIVWAIAEGREAARSVDTYLMDRVLLPTKGPGDLPRRR